MNELLLARILGLNGKITNTEEFQKANIIPKTIRVNADGSITESMSFPAFVPKKLIEEEWDVSEFKEYLEQAKFLFVIFKFEVDGKLIFHDLMFWNISQDDLEEVGIAWQRTVNILKEGVVLKQLGKRTLNKFPKGKRK